MIKEEGSWNLELLRGWISSDIIRCIVSVPLPHLSGGPDRISWCHTTTCGFSVKSAYRMLKEDSWNSRENKWKMAWKYPGSQSSFLHLDCSKIKTSSFELL